MKSHHFKKYPLRSSTNPNMQIIISCNPSAGAVKPTFSFVKRATCFHFESGSTWLRGEMSKPLTRPRGSYLQLRSRPAWRLCWRWNPALCWHWRSCGSAFCLGRVSAGFRPKSPPTATWASVHCGNRPQCSRCRCQLCAGENYTTPWTSRKKNVIIKLFFKVNTRLSFSYIVPNFIWRNETFTT